MRREQEDQEPHEQHDAPDWLDDSAAFFYADLDPDFEFEGYDYEWLSESMAPEQHDTCTTMAAETLPCQAISLPPGPGPVAGCAALSTPHDLGGPKSPEKHAAAPPGQSQRNLAGPEPDDKARASCTRKSSKKRSGKGGTAGLDRDTRWAEHLLNPCAAAIEAGNLARAQHLLYVLGELASFSGEANHRLAAHGLLALVLSHLPAAVGQAAAASIQIPYLKCSTPAFPCVEPRRFRAALIKFHEVSPWFALPNTLANAAIAQLATRGRHQMIRVIDVGVSHGTQWPTLLDALTRVPRGSAPPSVWLTVAGAAATPPAPFSASPPGYDSSPQLLQYARSINLDLAIDQTQCLETLHASPGEVLVACLQFRLNHATADEQAAVLGKVRSLNPELVVLAELDGGGGSSMSGEFAARLEMLWSFLESTEVAFKGSDADERRVMEVEAGTTLMTTTARRQGGAIAVDGRESWRARMAAAGFEEAQFGGEAVETAKAQLRKYDGGWELVPPSPATGAAVWLRWKRQPVSFCSLWRPA